MAAADAGTRAHLPFKLNMSGVIPPIFASSLIMFPATLATWFSTAEHSGWLQQRPRRASGIGQPLHMMLYAR